MQSRSAGFMPARASAWWVASRASVAPVSPSDTQWRVLIPERWLIHSSDVSIMVERSSFVTTRSGTWNPVAMNSVRGMGPFLARNRRREKISPATRQSKGVHGSHGHACAVRRRARGAAPARRPAQGPGRGDPPGRRIPAPAHVRGGDGAERAVRLERAHRLERCGQAGIAGVRRAGAGDPDASGLLKKVDGRTERRNEEDHTTAHRSRPWHPSLFPLPSSPAFGPEARHHDRRLLGAEGRRRSAALARRSLGGDRKSTRLNSSHGYISYAVFCLKKKKKRLRDTYTNGRS